jgi:hypothetical protein
MYNIVYIENNHKNITDDIKYSLEHTKEWLINKGKDFFNEMRNIIKENEVTEESYYRSQSMALTSSLNSEPFSDVMDLKTDAKAVP